MRCGRWISPFRPPSGRPSPGKRAARISPEQSGLALGTDGTIYVALGSAREGGALRLDRRPRSRDADTEGLVHRARRRLQRDANRRSPQGQGSDRGDRERWTPVPARRGIARRQRSQDAARRDAEVHGPRRRNGPRDVRRRGQPLDPRDGFGHDERGEVRAKRPRADRTRRRVQVGGRRGQLVARSRLAVARSDVAARADCRERHGHRRLER